MKFKERAIIDINNIIYSRKSKLSKEDLETLILLREAIRNENSKTGLIGLISKLASLAGIILKET